MTLWPEFSVFIIGENAAKYTHLSQICPLAIINYFACIVFKNSKFLLNLALSIITAHVDPTWSTVFYGADGQQSTRVACPPTRALPVKLTLSLLDPVNGQTTQIICASNCF